MDQPRPSDYPIGSLKSRAAARMWLKNTRDARPRFEIVTNIYHPNKEHEDETIPYATGWSNWGDKLMRMVYHPIRWEKSPTAPCANLPGLRHTVSEPRNRLSRNDSVRGQLRSEARRGLAQVTNSKELGQLQPSGTGQQQCSRKHDSGRICVLGGFANLRSKLIKCQLCQRHDPGGNQIQ